MSTRTMIRCGGTTFTGRMVGDGSRSLRLHEGAHVEPLRVGDRSPRVGGGDQPAPPLGEEARGVASDGTEALHHAARAVEVHADVCGGDVDRRRQPEPRRPDLVQGNPADLRGQPDGAADLVARPGHAQLVETHVGSGDELPHVDEGGGERSNEPLLLVDNCFALHAVAGWRASRQSEGSALFTSIPSFGKVLASVQDHPPILMGGREFGSPSVMLRLLPELSEYFWLRQDWIERMALPRSHLWVEWVEPVDSAEES